LLGEAEPSERGGAVERAQRALSGQAGSLVTLGRALIELGDGEPAEGALLDAIRQDNSLSGKAEAIIWYYFNRRLYNCTSRWLDRLEAVIGRTPLFLFWRASLLQGRGQLHLAVPVLEEALRSPAVEAGLRNALVDTLFLTRRDLGQQSELAALLDSLESAVESQWESVQAGRSRVFLWRARAALYFRDSSSAHRWLQRVSEVEAESGSDVVDRTPSELALLALDGRTAVLRDAVTDRDHFRQAASDLSDASSRLPLREEVVRRAEGEGASNSELCALYFELGIDRAELHRENEALAAYQRAHELWDSPVQKEGFWQYGPYSVHNSAVSLDNTGKYDRAASTWREAADAYAAIISTNDPYLQWAIGSAYFRLDHLGLSYQACIRGLEYDNENIALLLRLIQLNKEWQDSRGRRYYERESQAQSRTPNPDSDLDESLAWRSRDAIRKVRPLLLARAAQSRNASHLREYASFLLDKTDYRDARPYILKAASLDPDDAQNHKLLARWNERDGNNREALLEYQAALDLEPDDLETRSNLGQVQAKLGNREAARVELSKVRDTAPAHIETLIRLADIYAELGDESEDGAYEKAIELYGEALKYHRHGTGSKFLTTSEMASILYQRGYCRVRLYEATPNALRSQNFLRDAIKDFDECLSVESSHDKARSAKKKLTARGAQLLLSARERYGPWAIFACALSLLVLAQVEFFVFHHLSASVYATLTLGGFVLAIAGLVLPELLKLKVGGFELEKSSVEQQQRPTSFNLSR
jgi:tetratricopeptide (TPR) repeat protein